jgi:hypothetical protein
MKYAIVLLAVLLSGCKVEKMENLSESAVVRDVIYQPSQHGGGMGVGMSMSGNMVVTSNSVSIPAKYAIVFECQHGKFIVEGEGKKHKELWQRLKVGQQVQVTYSESWRVHDDGRRELWKRSFVDAK